MEFHGLVFAEPTLDGVTTYKALQIRAYCLGKLKDFD